MGRWMEIKDASGTVVAETTPNLLIYATNYMPRAVKIQFPRLYALRIDSEAWNDELQVLQGTALQELLNEVEHLKAFASGVTQPHEAYVPDMDATAFGNRWLGTGRPRTVAESQLENIIAMLRNAVQNNHSAHISL